MDSTIRTTLAVFLSLVVGMLAVVSGHSPRTADQVSEAEIQRLLHGVMEQLGIARPRVEYPAHQATNIVGPQSIQGKLIFTPKIDFICDIHCRANEHSNT